MPSASSPAQPPKRPLPQPGAQQDAEGKRRLIAKTSHGPQVLEAAGGLLGENINSKMLKRVADAKRTVLANEHFQDIMSAEALSDGGMARVSMGDLRCSLVANKHYTAAFNLFAVVDFMRFVTQDTPVHGEKVLRLGEHFWTPSPTDTTACPYTIVLAALESDGGDATTIPPLEMLSPPEYAWAFLFAIEQAINNDATDGELQAFRRVALTFTLRLEIVESRTERHWRAHRLRQGDTQVGDVAKQTPVQCMYSVMATKALLEKTAGKDLGAEATCKAWQENVKMASSSEPMKTAYIDAVLTIWNRCMDDAVCRHLIVWQDTQRQPIFDSIYKLEAIIKKAQALPNIRYSLGYLIDMVYNQNTSAGEFAVRQISGRGLAGGKGKIDMILAKKELSQCLKNYASEKRCSDQFQQKLALWTDGIHYYRRDMQCGVSPYEIENSDVTWVAGLSPVETEILRLFEDAVVNKVFDDQLMQARLNGSAIVDLLKRAPMADRLLAIEEEADDAEDGKPSGPVSLGSIQRGGDNGFKSVMNQCEDDGAAIELKGWGDFARNTFLRYVKLIVDPGLRT